MRVVGFVPIFICHIANLKLALSVSKSIYYLRFMVFFQSGEQVQ